MEALKKIGIWFFSLVFVAFIIYRSLDGWIINPPKPVLVKQGTRLFVEEPTSPFMHYLFGSVYIREARENVETGRFEFQKNGQWQQVPD
jgi:hypothetical protein